MDFYTNVTQWGNNLLVRAFENGERRNYRVRYKPTLYVPVAKETGWKTLEGRNVMPYPLDDIKSTKEFLEQYKDQPHLVYGMDKYAYTYIADEYSDQVNWDMDKLCVVTIDIEVACENGFPNQNDAIEPFLSITVKNQSTKQIIVWGVGEYSTSREDVEYIHCETERELIAEFLAFWESTQPDIVTGWNTEFFDIPYIVNRIRHVMGEEATKRLSPWGVITSKTVKNFSRENVIYNILGVANMDYLELYKKFTYTGQESYRLDHIAYVELGDRKDDNPYETFREWYTKDYQSFIDYNIQDVEIVDRLEDKMKLIELALTMAYEAKVNYEDIFGSVKYWDVLIYNFLRERNIVIPTKKHGEKSEKYEGAYVKEPYVGKHDWVLSFDLNSLYPHLIMQYNISPETLQDGQIRFGDNPVDILLSEQFDLSSLKEKNICITPNGAMFDRSKQGFLPMMMETMYNDRVKYKKLMLQAKQNYEDTKDPKYLKDISRYNNIQMARKISLNSAYGAIGNVWFRYYDLRIAEGITTSGQLSIRWVENRINQYLNKVLGTDETDYVIASDTDSLYIKFGDLVHKVFGEGNYKPEDCDETQTSKIVNFLDTVAKEKIEPFIDKSYRDLASYVNAYDQKMQMKREVIADKGIWTAKKRYILNAWDVEGVRYNEPTLKIMGIEAVKSSTPAPCREKIKEALKIIMRGSEKELNQFIQDFREEFMKMEPETIAFPRSVNGLSKWMDSSSIFKKGTPMHIKGALIYNHLVKKNKLTAKYPLIQEGDKVKFVNLMKQNQYQSNVITLITKLPKELDIHRLVDYDIQFDKSFVEPLIFILETINWNVDRSYGTQNTLEDFFS